MAFNAKDFRGNYHGKVPIRPGQNIDHRVECQAAAHGANNRSHYNAADLADMKMRINATRNLMPKDARQNMREGQNVRAWLAGNEDLGRRAANKMRNAANAELKHQSLRPQNRKIYESLVRRVGK
jgi:hypothetical protein